MIEGAFPKLQIANGFGQLNIEIDSNGREEISKINEARVKSINEQTKARKGYVKLSTTLGTIIIELHCNLVPRTCEILLVFVKKNISMVCLFIESFEISWRKAAIHLVLEEVVSLFGMEKSLRMNFIQN